MAHSRLNKSLLEVACPPLCGWCYLFYGFQFSSAFQPRCRNWFFPISLSPSAEKKEHYPPVTLNFDF